jgi:hypothetical protein
MGVRFMWVSRALGSCVGRACRYSEATHTTPPDVPAKPAAPRVALVGAQMMEVSWEAPHENGAPIEWFALHMGVITPTGSLGSGPTEVLARHSLHGSLPIALSICDGASVHSRRSPARGGCWASASAG